MKKCGCHNCKEREDAADYAAFSAMNLEFSRIIETSYSFDKLANLRPSDEEIHSVSIASIQERIASYTHKTSHDETI